MPAPHVSICIPAHRAEHFLAATLDSVRAQTLTNRELIATEDGSRDRTGEIVRAFASSVAQPVRYTHHDPQPRPARHLQRPACSLEHKLARRDATLP